MIIFSNFPMIINSNIIIYLHIINVKGYPLQSILFIRVETASIGQN